MENIKTQSADESLNDAARRRHEALDQIMAMFLVANPGRMLSQCSALELAVWHAQQFPVR